VKRSRKPLSAAEKRAKEAYEETVLGRGNGCVMAPESPCDGPLDAHHVLSKQFLKAHVSTLEEQAGLAIIWDPANGVKVCRKHHGLLTTKARRLTRAMVPQDVWDFAAANGLVWLLQRELDGRPPFGLVESKEALGG